MTANKQQGVIAVAGATGLIGQNITDALLRNFTRVLVLTRNPSSEKALALAQKGAELVHLPDLSNESQKQTIIETLKAAGIDVLINALGFVTLEEKNAIAEVGIKSGAAVYFPSEYGADVRETTDVFTAQYEHSEWVKKRHHVKFAEELVKRENRPTKIISLYVGLFLEEGLLVRASLIGLDFAGNTITSLSPAARITYTSRIDIANTIAQLCILALKPTPTSSAIFSSDAITTHVRVAGYVGNAYELAAEIKKARAGGPKAAVDITIREGDLQAAKEALKAGSARAEISSVVGVYLPILVAEGKFDFSASNANELINPGEKLWKWKTPVDLAREHGL